MDFHLALPLAKSMASMTLMVVLKDSQSYLEIEKLKEIHSETLMVVSSDSESG